jgi:hypothetical protein
MEQRIQDVCDSRKEEKAHQEKREVKIYDKGQKQKENIMWGPKWHQTYDTAEGKTEAKLPGFFIRI